MKFLFVTLFPEQIEQAANHSIIQRAVNKGLVEISCINPREFTHDVHRTVDDTPFGGGAGMVLKPEPMVAAIRKAKEQLPNARVIAMCPGGRTLKQSIVEEYAHCGQDFIFVCGHYEGFDERIFNWVDEKLSIGDYVLTGGEMPALIVMDAIARFIPGVLGKLVSAEEDSFSTGLLEYPQYTRPVNFEGLEVPEVLRGGNHALIAAWRLQESLKATYFLRPDLLTEEQLRFIEKPLPYKMKKSQRKFWEELRSKIAAAAKAELAAQAEVDASKELQEIAAKEDEMNG